MVCAADEAACQNDPSGECPLLEECLGFCSGDQTCITGCGLTFPGGVHLFNMVATCILCACSEDCAPAPPGCP
jgi:hypothetical protein